jgi:hypothetical protein
MGREFRGSHEVDMEGCTEQADLSGAPVTWFAFIGGRRIQSGRRIVSIKEEGFPS